MGKLIDKGSAKRDDPIYSSGPLVSFKPTLAQRHKYLHEKTGGTAFDIQSFIGTEIGDPTSPCAEKCPRSAKHVVTISWSWSPMHSRRSEYRIATDQSKQTWNLYEISLDPDTGRRISARVATGSPHRGISAEKASHLLLKAAWLSEIDLWEFDPTGFEVDDEGLLVENDLSEIVSELAWITRSSWLRDQAPDSLSALKTQLPKTPDDQIVDTIEEVIACIEDLALPSDFLQLCKHYKLEQPCLLSLVFAIATDSAAQRVKKEVIVKSNISNFTKLIDLLVSDLDDQVGRGGGMTIPSVKSRTRAFLEKYVGEHGELPRGEHVIHAFFKKTIDFDELRNKYSV